MAKKKFVFQRLVIFLIFLVTAAFFIYNMREKYFMYKEKIGTNMTEAVKIFKIREEKFYLNHDKKEIIYLPENKKVTTEEAIDTAILEGMKDVAAITSSQAIAVEMPAAQSHIAKAVVTEKSINIKKTTQAATKPVTSSAAVKKPVKTEVKESVKTEIKEVVKEEKIPVPIQAATNKAVANSDIINEDEFHQNKPENQKPVYYLQIGIFGKEENAKQMASTLSGYTVRIVETKKGLKRVIVDGIDSRDEAIRISNEIAAKNGGIHPILNVR